MNTVPTTEERTWAVISHLSAIAFGMGILLPIIGWSEQRRKSNYASFQCLQALGYQSLGFTIWVLSYLVVIILASMILLIMLGSRGENSENMDSVAALGMVIIFVVVFGFLAIYLLLPIIAAVSCALGRDFRYPILGNRLGRYLAYDPVSNSEEQTWLLEDHEFRWVAAMGHLSILILLWGMLAPLTALLLQGKHSLFLKFQSMQTLIYQAAVTVLYFGAVFVYMFGIFLLVAGMGIAENLQTCSSEVIPGFIIFIIASFITIAILLLIPLLHVIGQYAGYRVLKGDDYHYPLVGRLVEQWMSKQVNSGEENLL